MENRLFDLFKKIESGKDKTPSQPVTYLLVGLGNPGREYTFTRHNTGFLAMDYLSQKLGVTVDRAKFHALCGEAVISGKRVLLMKPQTYMNRSGEAVREAAEFYKIPPENILVLCDDVTLEVGCLRVRRKGSDGGQKGLRSIITEIGSDTFPRVRFGVGAKPHPDYDLAAWVLSEFTKEEQQKLFDAFVRSYDGILSFLAGDMETAVRLCNAGKVNS